MGGLACNNIRKKLVGSKWAVIHRNDTKRDTTSSLLTRGDMLNGTIRYPGQMARIRAAEGLWATTLLQDTERAGLFLHRGGDLLTGTTSEQIVDTTTYVNEGDLHKVVMRRLGLSTVGDLTTVIRDERKWNSDLHNLSPIIAEIMKGDCPQGDIKLRPQQ